MMTSVESVESDGAFLFSLDPTSLEIENIKKEEHHPAITQACINSLAGLLRMREEEDLMRVLSANLRELDSQEKFSEGIKRINTLIENHIPSWYKEDAYLICAERLAPTHPDLALEYTDKLDDWDQDKAYLLCVKRLASTHLDLALEYADKIKDNRNKAKAYLHIAKYQNDAQVTNTLQKAAELFSPYNAEVFIPYYDELLAREGEAVTIFFGTIHTKTLQYWYQSANNLLALAELEIKLQMPYAKVTLNKAYTATLIEDDDWGRMEDLLRLLECEIQIDPLLIPTTIEKIHASKAYNKWWWDRCALIAFEAKHPSLIATFEKDFEEALALAEDDFDLFDLVEAIAMYQKTAAEKAIERIEDNRKKALAYLALVKALAQESEFDITAAAEEFKEKLENTKITDLWDLTEIFTEAAEIFGLEKSRFLLDKAIVLAQPTIDQLYAQELKETGRTLKHYLGETFGIDLPHPNKDSKDIILSRFSNISDDLSALLRAFARYNFPETQEILQLFYEKIDGGEKVWGREILAMIEAEFTLLGL